MRDIATKVDTSSSLTAAEFNSFINELENLVTRPGIALDAAAGPDNDLFMIARSVLIHAQAGMSYQDGGAANSFVLSPIQANFNQPTAYVDGMTVRFKAAATNTGACTINVDGLGAISFTKAGGTAYAAGEIVAGNIITATYFNGTNRFEEVSNTTPEASSPAAADQVAVYADAGSVSQATLTIEPGYTQPAAHTDQMVVLFKANATNDGVGTHPVSITGLAAKDMVETDGTDPIAGRITAGDWVMLVFREVRDKFEIAFVYDNPKKAATVPATVTSSSGTVFNLGSVSEVRAPTAYTDGMVVIFRAPQTNTGSVDVNLNSIGAVDLRNLAGANFTSGQISSNDQIIATFITSENRFRAAVIEANPANPLSVNRSAVIFDPSVQTISTTDPVLIRFLQAPISDPIGFYSAAADTFVVPADVDAIDAQFTVAASFASGETDSAYTAFIRVDGNAVASQSTSFARGVEHATVFALDVPVTAGQVIEGVITKTGSANLSVTSGTKLVVRASRFPA